MTELVARTGRAPNGWAGWSTTAAGADSRVTSDRLGSRDVANRMFPKVRSWLALGAPLELLSPLSIARIVALLAAATWFLGALVGVLAVAAGVSLGVAGVAGVVVMMRMKLLSEPQGFGLLAMTTLLVDVAVATSTSAHRVELHALLLAALAIYAGLFLRARALLLAQVVLLVSTTVAVQLGTGGSGFGDASAVLVFTVLLSAVVSLTARTSRMSGLLDGDTGLANARGLEGRVDDRDRERVLVIATVHLSGVAEVRDALGHNAGIELVRRAVEDLGQVLPTHARLGRNGDDIVVVVDADPAVTDAGRLEVATVGQIDVAIGSGRYMVGEIEVSLIAHVGVTTAAVGCRLGAGELLRQSALAARSAMESGRAVARWHGEQTTFTAEDLTLLADLRTASERGELWIAYQPQVRTPDGRIVAAEALLRWSSDQHGFVPPGRFIPLAERTGFVDRLTDWVLEEALEAQCRWRRAGFDITVSVNVSPLSLRSLEFAERVIAMLDERSLPPDVLMLEVTESVAFDVPEAVERLAPLRARGVKISIDDFGTGYTSLAILPQLPLDELKVDQQFVKEAATSSASEAIVRSVCELGHRLGLCVVAEGVEDAPLAELMTVFGYDLLQGYHFARPMPEPDLLRRLVEQDDLDRPAPGRGASPGDRDGRETSRRTVHVVSHGAASGAHRRANAV